MSSWFELQHTADSITLQPNGSWRLAHLPEFAVELNRSISQLASVDSPSRLVIDCSRLEEIDTAGAMTAYRALIGTGLIGNGGPNARTAPQDIEGRLARISVTNATADQVSILELTKQSLAPSTELKAKDELNTVGRIGRDTVDLIRSTAVMLDFIGRTFVECLRMVIHPSRFRFREFCVQLEECGYKAIPIALLVTFLIGIVIAYLSGIQIEKYGANIFIVDGVTLAVCRELSPILVAIIVAGRSGSAFTAQIGTMKLNEELDAMSTMDLSPMRVLVIPRIFALMVVMPLLVFLGDLSGIAGGMVIADLRLGVTGATFVERMHAVLLPKSVIVGLVKAPVFAYFIGAIACRMGLTVENNAQSVGSRTTSTVVQSIVMVILLNAAFAVIFSELRI